jgi:hypothetical protein
MVLKERNLEAALVAEREEGLEETVKICRTLV